MRATLCSEGFYVTIHASIGEGSEDTALRLARHFVTSPQCWLNVQKAWELRQAEIVQPGGEIVEQVTPRQSAA